MTAALGNRARELGLSGDSDRVGGQGLAPTQPPRVCRLPPGRQHRAPVGTAEHPSTPCPCRPAGPTGSAPLPSPTGTHSPLDSLWAQPSLPACPLGPRVGPRAQHPVALRKRALSGQPRTHCTSGGPSPTAPPEKRALVHPSPPRLPSHQALRASTPREESWGAQAPHGPELEGGAQG